MATQPSSPYLPEKRLFLADWSTLSDPELLALLLSGDCSQEKAWWTAVRLLGRFKTLAGLQSASYAELCESGLKHRECLRLLAALALAPRLRCRELEPGQSFRSSFEIYEHFRGLAADLKKECFWDVLLDGKNRITKVLRISEGSLTSSLVHPREVFRPAIQEAAAAVLFVHNHPSGDPSPSQEDIQITRRLVETGKIVGIRPLDHVIISGFRYFSFADQGLL